MLLSVGIYQVMILYTLFKTLYTQFIGRWLISNDIQPAYFWLRPI